MVTINADEHFLCRGYIIQEVVNQPGHNGLWLKIMTVMQVTISPIELSKPARTTAEGWSIVRQIASKLSASYEL